MPKDDIDINAQRIAAIASIKQVVEDLGTAYANKEAEIRTKLNKAKIERESIKAQVTLKKQEYNKLKKANSDFKKRLEEIKKKEERIEKTEELLEKEKKLLTGKKQHLMEWEKELTEKARRIDG
jgi:chromosome segregation ATPase